MGIGQLPKSEEYIPYYLNYNQVRELVTDTSRRLK